MGRHYCGDVQANDNSRLHLGDNYYYGHQETLKHIPSALYNAYGLEHKACHPGTRKDLLGKIVRWAEQPTGKSIFWLNGMAGTGKSTIAYTVAERLNQQSWPGRATLGASFFFKRGETDRASAALFFPTIVRQLCQQIPGLTVCVNQAVDTNPDICSKALGEQFDKLLQGPLGRLGDCPSPTTYVVVVDALDECQKEDDIRILLQLWSSLGRSPHQSVRWFLTSRPELPIQLEFSRMSSTVRQDVVLHEMPPPMIKHDISIFLAATFSQIRDVYNFAPPSGVPLSEDWPGAAVLEELIQMAVPLFIIAATICRFVKDEDFDPQDQLRAILQSRRAGHISDLGKIYLPILERVLSSSVDVTTQNQIYYEFRLIVGAIVTLAEPLSRLGSSVLLNLAPATIVLRLKSLHSVLQVPREAEAPIRPLHLSFGEFLSSDEMRHQPFYVDRAATHQVLLTRCLDLLSRPSPDGLHENMCQLSYPGQPRPKLADAVVQKRFSSATRYACRYWTFHAQQSAFEIYDDGKVHHFLQLHFLHWLESLSLLGCLTDALGHIETLLSLLATTGSTHLAALLKDARRFILANRYICDLAPLQLYSSAIVFAPQESVIRQICGHVPYWVRRGPLTPRKWSAELQTLEGHTVWVWAVAFSPDGSQLASASHDRSVRLWDAKTGQEVQKLEGHTEGVSAVAFSPDGLQLASASEDRTVRLWNAKTGQEAQKLEGHTDEVNAVAFSPDGSQLASASDDHTVRLWNVKTGQDVQKLEGHTRAVNAVVFSPDGLQLASASDDHTVRLLDVKTGQEVQKLEGHTRAVNAVAFSPDGSQLASASYDRSVRLWNVKTGQEAQKLEGHTGAVRAVAFSPDGSQLASASDDHTVRLWDVKTGQEVQKLEGHTSVVRAVAFSPDGLQLASASHDLTVRLWDAKTGQEAQKLEGHTSVVRAMAFSPDGSQLASASLDPTVRLWNAKTGQEAHKLEGHTRAVNAVAFSPDGLQLASASDGRTVRLWNAKTGQEVQKLEGHTEGVMAVVFSPDSSQLASASHDETVRMWDAKTGQQLQKLKGHTYTVNAVAFSPDGLQLASASVDRTVRLWNAKTGQEVQKLEGHTRAVNAVAFSPDGLQLASASYDHTVRLWNVTTEQVHVFKDTVFSSKINFSDDGKTLFTNRGSVPIGSAPSRSRTHEWETNNNPVLRDDWIECLGQQILWLPHEHRGDASAVHDNILAIGCASGRVSFLQIEYP